MTRRSTPDILSEIMGGSAVKHEDSKAIKQENHKEIQHENNINDASDIENQSPAYLKTEDSPTKQENHKAIKQETNKEKATFNLSLEILDRLELSWINMKRQRKDKRITKTLIVEAALKYALDEYDRLKEESEFFKNL